jgi:hypothetical protein
MTTILDRLSKLDVKLKGLAVLLLLTVVGLVIWLIVWLVKRRQDQGAVGPQNASIILACNFASVQYYARVTGETLTMTQDRDAATRFGVFLLDDKDYVITHQSQYAALSRKLKSMSQLQALDKTKDRCMRLRKVGSRYEFVEGKQCVRVQSVPDVDSNAPTIVAVAPCTPAVAKFTKLQVQLL